MPWNAVQDLVPTVHRQPRQQPSLVSLASQQHCQRHKLCRRRAPRVRDGGPIPQMHQRQVAVLLALELRNLAEGGDEVVVERAR